MKKYISNVSLAARCASVACLWIVTAPAALSAGQTITVNTVDNVSGDSLCSFPEAARAAGNLSGGDACAPGSNSATDVDTINFAIGTGPQTITVTTMVEFAQPTFVNGASQPGFTGAPLIHITGALEDLMAFRPGTDGSTMKSLRVTNLAKAGDASCAPCIDRAGAIILSNNNTFIGNYFNVNSDATSVVGEMGAGLLFGSAGGDNNVIGGATPAERNLFGGQVGLYLQEVSNNTIEGNYFGVQPDGVTTLSGALGNGGSGIQIFTIGAEPATDNVVKGNVITGYAAGVNLSQGTEKNILEGNKIGVGADGTTPLGNQQGVLIFGASNNRIGGTTLEKRNIIAGNTSSQLSIGNVPNTNYFSNNNLIQGNYIGVDSTGSATTSPAAIYGIQMGSGSSNTIGGMEPGTGNLISGNQVGITISAAAASTKIQSNKFGVGANGNIPLPNTLFSIQHSGSMTTVQNNFIGNSPASGLVAEGAGTFSDDNSQNCFVGNGFGLNIVAGSPSANFSNNWWGSTDGPGGVAGGSGDQVSAGVVFAPFYTSKPGCPQFGSTDGGDESNILLLIEAFKRSSVP